MPKPQKLNSANVRKWLRNRSSEQPRMPENNEIVYFLLSKTANRTNIFDNTELSILRKIFLIKMHLKQLLFH